MNIIVDNMTLSDFDNIESILLTDFDDFWTNSILKQELQSDDSYFIVAKSDNQIIGFAGLKVIYDETEIMNIVVKKDYRKKGVGSLLLSKLFDLSKKLNINIMNLEVNERNLSAISLYRNFGFINVGLRKKYYNGIDNAILMKKIL